MANLKTKKYDSVQGTTMYNFGNGEVIDVYKMDEKGVLFYEAMYDDDPDTFFSGNIYFDDNGDVFDYDGCYGLPDNFFEIFDDLGLTYNQLTSD